jgi:hypothetical protein
MTKPRFSKADGRLNVPKTQISKPQPRPEPPKRVLPAHVSVADAAFGKRKQVRKVKHD